jgi:hypothetical protein
MLYVLTNKWLSSGQPEQARPSSPEHMRLINYARDGSRELSLPDRMYLAEGALDSFQETSTKRSLPGLLPLWLSFLTGWVLVLSILR